jgi:hypothetical protein
LSTSHKKARIFCHSFRAFDVFLVTVSRISCHRLTYFWSHLSFCSFCQKADSKAQAHVVLSLKKKKELKGIKKDKNAPDFISLAKP